MYGREITKTLRGGGQRLLDLNGKRIKGNFNFFFTGDVFNVHIIVHLFKAQIIH